MKAKPGPAAGSRGYLQRVPRTPSPAAPVGHASGAIGASLLDKSHVGLQSQDQDPELSAAESRVSASWPRGEKGQKAAERATQPVLCDQTLLGCSKGS